MMTSIVTELEESGLYCLGYWYEESWFCIYLWSGVSLFHIIFSGSILRTLLWQQQQQWWWKKNSGRLGSIGSVFGQWGWGMVKLNNIHLLPGGFWTMTTMMTTFILSWALGRNDIVWMITRVAGHFPMDEQSKIKTHNFQESTQPDFHCKIWFKPRLTILKIFTYLNGGLF